MFIMRPHFNRICAFLIILLGNEISGHFVWQSDFPTKRTKCLSPKCDAQAKYLHSFLNYDVNPCDDFYQYVCGKWGKNNPLPDYYPHWSIDLQMVEKSFERAKDILNTVPSHLDSTELRKARMLYEACMRIPYLGILDAKSLRKYIKFDNFPLILRKSEPLKGPKLSWLEVHNHYLSITGEPAFCSIEIVANAGNKMTPTLRISPMLSPFGVIELFETFPTNKMILYKEFLLAIIVHSIPSKRSKVSYTLIEKRLLDVIVFRRQLWKLINENLNKYTDCYLMTTKAFDSLYNYKKMEVYWANIIYSLYNATDNLLSITSVNVCLETKKYFDSLTQLLSKTDDDIIVNHIHLYFIERHLKLTSQLKEMLLKIVIQNGKLEAKIQYLGKRELECLLRSETTDGFGKVYIKRHFPQEIKRQGELLVNKLKDVMGALVSQSAWLDTDTKNKAMVKIENMTMAIGYPEYYDDPGPRTACQHARERVRVVSSDLFYLPMTNHLSISATYFNLPLYDPTFPPSVVYGTIGGLVGHEMNHAFSPCILNSKRLSSYWSDNMLSKYNEKVACFIKLYDKKDVKALRDIPNAPRIDGYKTIDENLADAMGLKLAYWTFRKKIWILKRCPVLRGPPDLTCDQLFFVSYALNFCSTLTVDRLMDVVQNERHCPDDLRLNAAVSNFKEFSKAFDCPNTAPMNPSKRCNLWM